MMKDIKGYEGKYAITSCGKVWSYKRKKFLTPAGYGKGYLQVCLGNGKVGDFTIKYVHRLVAEAFLPNPDNLPQVHHKDGNRENPALTNLEWVTAKQNLNHTQRTEKYKKRLKAPVYCIELDKTFRSRNQAAKELNLGVSNLTICLNDANTTCGGYHWRYAD